MNIEGLRRGRCAVGLALLASGLLLAGCGGSSGDAGGTTAAAATPPAGSVWEAAERAFSAGAYTVNVGSTEAYVRKRSIAGPLSTTAQPLALTFEALGPPLVYPAAVLGTRVSGAEGYFLLGAGIGTASTMFGAGSVNAVDALSANKQIRLVGGDVILDVMADQAGQVLTSFRIDAVTVAPLTGRVGDAPGPVAPAGLYYWTSGLYPRLDPGGSFRAGSAYVVIALSRFGDAVQVLDCSTPTPRPPQPVPCGAAASLRAAFPARTQTRTYQWEDGSVRNILGREVWVRNTPGATTLPDVSEAIVIDNGN